jgi:hypothetical protein
MDYANITTLRADELMPGDVFDTHCGIGDLAWATIARARLIEIDNPHSEDRIEVTMLGGGISNTREFLASSPVSAIVRR